MVMKHFYTGSIFALGKFLDTSPIDRSIGVKAPERSMVISSGFRTSASSCSITSRARYVNGPSRPDEMPTDDQIFLSNNNTESAGADTKNNQIKRIEIDVGPPGSRPPLRPSIGLGTAPEPKRSPATERGPAGRQRSESADPPDVPGSDRRGRGMRRRILRARGGAQCAGAGRAGGGRRLFTAPVPRLAARHAPRLTRGMERARAALAAAAAAPDMRAPRRRTARPRERWLLTRKTWRYMSDAGRRLAPDAPTRAEDLPRLEALFQEACAREPRFLLWRKASYPGAAPRPRRKRRARGGSVRAASPEPPPEPPRRAARPADLAVGHTSGGRFDLAKLRRDFFTSPPATRSPRPARSPERASPERDPDLVDLLRRHLRVEEEAPAPDPEGLVRALRAFLRAAGDVRPSDGDTEPARRALADHLARHGRLAHSERAVRDLLADKASLRRLYQDLRKPKPYRGARSGGGGGAGGAPAAGGPGGFGPSPVSLGGAPRLAPRWRPSGAGAEGPRGARSPPLSPPPLIEVQHESLEERREERGTQTAPLAEETLAALEREHRARLEAATAPTSPTSPPPERKAGRRRSSVDHDDVRQSVTDHVMRYLRMARKKSVDTDKDRFKRINYDKNLRNIRPRTPADVDDDGPHKGCQTAEDWILTYRELRFASAATTPTSPTQNTSFLSTLLARGGSVTCAVSAGGMQKSRSSSSVVQSVSKRLWRTRSRSSSRAAASWTPQGSCVWCDGSGRCVRLTDTSLLTLSEVERRALQQAALARLQQILGTTIKIPDENAVASTKPKRRAYLLKRKALTTGFFDQSRAKDDKEKETTSGSVFGVPLAQCVATERALRRQQHGGSRASLASLGALEKGDDSGSCDSGEWGWAGLEEAGGGGPRVPGLVSACLAHLRRHGLHTLGLFRVSASKKRVRQLREDWERSQEVALDAAVCPHDVATLLKEFLRDLPDPLLCRDLYPVFLQTQKLHNRHYQWEAMRLIVQLLPAAHRDTLNALLSFLAQLAAHAEDSHQPGNKMDAANLATVFAPNILHRNKPNEAANAEQLSERADVINVVRQLVERQAELWTLPAELLHEAYIHLAHSAPAHLDPLLLRKAEVAAEQASAESSEGLRRVWSRESCLHGAAATGGPGHVQPARRSEKSYSRSRRARDAASDTSSGSLSSAMTIVTRVRSSEECGSSGVVCSTPAPRTDSTADSNDSASDYNETLGGSDDDCVITASLHIPAAFSPPSPRAPSAPPRRRSTSGSEGSKRDSAVGSSSSSPPGSPPPVAPLRVTVTAGEVRRSTEDRHRTTDIDRLVGLGRERNTSDARAVVLRQHDESTTAVRSRVSSRHEQTLRKEEHTTRKEDGNRREEHSSRREEQTIRREEKKEGTLYKRGELISSARSPPT